MPEIAFGYSIGIECPVCEGDNGRVVAGDSMTARTGHVLVRLLCECGWVGLLRLVIVPLHELEEYGTDEAPLDFEEGES